MSASGSRSAKTLNNLLINYLKKYDLHHGEHCLWNLEESQIGGLGIFAKQDILAGETIFKDYPVIIGPRALPGCPLVCVVCFSNKNLKGCGKDCGLPVCSQECQNSEIHSQECQIITKIRKDLNNNAGETGFISATESTANPSSLNLTAKGEHLEKNIANSKKNTTDNSGHKNDNKVDSKGFTQPDLKPVNTQFNGDASSSLSNNQHELTEQCKSPITSTKLFNNLTPIRALFLDKNDKNVVRSLVAHQGGQHGHEIHVLKKEFNLCFNEDEEKFMRLVCCVMDANAFEVTTGEEDNQSSIRGLYPLGSLANHRCYPNTFRVFDKEHRMVCRAAVDIPKGSEIFTSYTRIMWGSVTRLYHLKRTKHFICRCERCEDPTEFGTYMSAVLCKKCRGKVIPLNPYKVQERWQCEDCKSCISGSDVGHLIQTLGSILGNIQPTDFEFMSRLLNEKLTTVVPESSQVTVELKLKIIWFLGHKVSYQWQDLSSDLLQFKKQLCEDILNLLEQLRTGQSKIKALILCELYRCHQEIFKRRGSTRIDDNQIMNGSELSLLFEEARYLLHDDVSAPKLFKDTSREKLHINSINSCK